MAFLVRDVVALEERPVFLLERDRPMVLGLIGDVRPHPSEVGAADGGRATARPPGEVDRRGEGLVNPLRGIDLDPPRRIGHRDPPAERDERMDVVRHPSGRQQDAAAPPHDAADVVIKPRTDLGRQSRRPVPSAEDQMIMQAYVRLRHGKVESGGGWTAPSP